MNRRDPNAEPRQAGAQRSDDGWSTQASQWQADSDHQAGGHWEADEQRGGRHGGSRNEGYVTDSRHQTGYGETGYGDAGWSEQVRRDRGYRGRPHGGAGSSSQGWAGSQEWGSRERGPNGDRGYRFSGADESGYATRSFDASGGNDFNSFTSEDYGGRDFSSGRRGLSGGMRSSESYRPSYGPGSWSSRSSSRDYDDWRGYGEQRGFLERAGDEIASWFGDEDASRRREADHRGRGPSDYTRSDDRIREDVNDSLTHDWRIDASNVRVKVKDGEVTLDGTVGNRQDKRRAEDLAESVTGAKHVQNNLRVQTDTGLTAGTQTPGYAHTASSGSGTGSTGSSS